MQREQAPTETQVAEDSALQDELTMERPIEALNSIWIEELTWIEIRDAMAAGTKTVIIPTGGIEQNGPYVAMGKHNYVLQGACEGIARELGNALCAPIVKLVPEGGIDEPTGHMRYPGTISLREETFHAVLDDVASSLQAHGFENIVFIGDSGGNQDGMAVVADRLNERWGKSIAHYIPEFYDNISIVENDRSKGNNLTD
jgi:creatinine amidohydrolase/Fe(II)-dependent formamide hydrolase-like protein